MKTLLAATLIALLCAVVLLLASPDEVEHLLGKLQPPARFEGFGPAEALITGHLHESSPHGNVRVVEQKTNSAKHDGLEWQKVSLEFTAPKWGPFINIVFVGNASTAYMDDFLLMPVDRASEMKEHMRREVRRSEPDYIAYVPGSYDGSTNDSHNEHFLVFEGPDDSLMAVWTQSSGLPEAQRNRIMFSRSDDNGVTWLRPKRLVGPTGADDSTNMASWAFPMVSQSGRIYVVYNQNQGNSGWIKMHTGTMDAIYSDDNGQTWSKPQTVPMPHSPYDDPEGKIPPEWIVWQIPMRDRKGGYLVGYTRWVNESVARYNKRELPGDWTWIESVCEFMRFENVDENPEPRDLRVRYSAWGDEALRVPHWKDPLLSIAQEPSLVRLPDDRLFCVMRTNSGYIWYSVSGDDGYTWSNPRPLLRKDHGRPILQPVSCCPIYQLANGRYVLLHHNNRGDINARPENTARPRRPAYVALGEFRPGADQPLWFSPSKEFMDTGGYTISGEKGDSQIGVYSSLATRGGRNVLWHPDRKCFLVGKEITDAFLTDLAVPKK